MHTMDLFTLRNLRSRAASAENPDALPGAGGTANDGHKGAPCIWPLSAGKTYTLLDVDGPGRVRHIWMTFPPGRPTHLRNLILRMYWDGAEFPSVEAPVGDFFGVAHGRQRPFTSDYVAMQSGKGLNCWIPMPFARHARITVENDSGEDVRLFFYQVDFTLGDEFTPDTGYFHARFRRENPCPIGTDYELLSTAGRGVYLGTVLGVRSLFTEAWWGEGEMKFYVDSDTTHPTICGTGTEDYMGSAWGLVEVSTPQQGAPLVDKEAALFSLYRFHGRDPIYFQDRLRVTIQQIGYGETAKAKAFYGDDFRHWDVAGDVPGNPTSYFPRRDDYSSVAYWYQTPAVPASAEPFPDRALRSADIGGDQAAPKRDDQ